MSLKRGDVPQFDEVLAAQFTVGTSAAALTSTSLSVSGLAALQADPTNSGNISLGDANGQYFTLVAGDSFPFLVPVTNLSLFYAIGSASNQKLNAIVFK